MPRSQDCESPQLNTGQIEQFIAKGYLSVSGLIPPETVRATRERIWSELCISPGDPTTWPENPILVPHQLHPLMAPCRTPAIESVARQLVGPQFAHGGGYSPVINFPRPGPAEFSPMGLHIDGIDESTLWPVKRYLVMLVYLNDTAAHGGALAVVPGSHRQAFEHWIRTDTGPAGSTVPPALDYPPAIPIPGAAGDVIFMHYLLVHASSHNRSETIRVALNGTIRPDPVPDFYPRCVPPQPGWSPLDVTLRVDNLTAC
jgi:hypothetical protein